MLSQCLGTWTSLLIDRTSRNSNNMMSMHLRDPSWPLSVTFNLAYFHFNTVSCHLHCSVLTSLLHGRMHLKWRWEDLQGASEWDATTCSVRLTMGLLLTCFQHCNLMGVQHQLKWFQTNLLWRLVLCQFQQILNPKYWPLECITHPTQFVLCRKILKKAQNGKLLFYLLSVSNQPENPSNTLTTAMKHPSYPPQKSKGSNFLQKT